MCKNWYPENNELGTGKAVWSLNPSPGLSLFCASGGSKTRGQTSINGRTFAVSDANFYEISAAGVKTIRNGAVPLADDTFQCSFAVSAIQILIASAGLVYLFTLATNTFQAIDPTKFDGNVSQVHYVDGFFIAVLLNSQKFQFSGILDGTAWDALDFDVVEVLPDNIVGSIADHRELVLMGGTKTTVYQNTGDALDPFQVVGSGSFIEQGTEARLSLARLDNSIFWLGGDDRGAGVAWKAQGYQPTRISNHAVENEWQSYSTRADAIGFAYQDQGHNFYQLYFPTADKTWRYDVENRMWCQVTSILANAERAHLSQSHTYCFGKHLVGDWNSGNIYQMAIPQYDTPSGQWLFADDNGSPIRRIRRAPYLFVGMDYIFYHALQIDAEAGLGPQPPLAAATYTNLLLWSEQFDNVAWIRSNVTSVTANSVTDPFGGATADAVLYSVTGTTAQLFQDNVTTPGITYTFSCYIKAASGSPTITLLLFDGTGSASIAAQTVTLNQTWQRFSVTGTTPPGCVLMLTYLYNPSSNSIAYHFWGAQLEQASSAGTYAETQGASASVSDARDPQMMLRWSDTSTKRWSNEYILNAGKAGEFTKRLIKRMMGRGRQRVIEISTSDPIPWRIAGAYIDVS